MKRGITVLVVDDEPLLREAMQRLLERDGYDVEVFSDARFALARLKERAFDLVITDFSMPGMAGDEFIARIREFLPAQRILMATAFVEEYRVFGQPAGGADAVLLKPFAFKELSDAVEMVLAQSHSGHPSAMPPIIQHSHVQDLPPRPKSDGNSG